MLFIAIYVVVIIANWKVFEKLGRKGWECIIPIYNLYVLFDVIDGQGWKVVLLFVPFVNIYIFIKLNIEIARSFGQSAAFAAGLILLNPIFMGMLGFGNYDFNEQVA